MSSNSNPETNRDETVDDAIEPITLLSETHEVSDLLKSEPVTITAPSGVVTEEDPFTLMAAGFLAVKNGLNETERAKAGLNVSPGDIAISGAWISLIHAAISVLVFVICTFNFIYENMNRVGKIMVTILAGCVYATLTPLFVSLYLQKPYEKIFVPLLGAFAGNLVISGVFFWAPIFGGTVSLENLRHDLDMIAPHIALKFAGYVSGIIFCVIYGIHTYAGTAGGVVAGFLMHPLNFVWVGFFISYLRGSDKKSGNKNEETP
ncbi:hypothetical protein HK098_000093 [Nowakowskiella sp. JEL0407]|nr:hypothetical protein HK098_000093 [Nowakowskiella sp. JEL0407]